ncbi:MAG TPA: hypothetical protein VNO82_25925 [Solirubrobacteraceae bacterium]|nr:hypothetical protein [Solirubrobacteraceae bacterium]
MRLLTALLLAAAGIAAAPAAASAAPATCPATFSVLHDDRIGTLSVPAGPYQITVSDSAALSCGRASDLFRQFLEDWDGRLPFPWKLDASTSTFTGATGRSFSIARASSGGGGGGQHPATGLRCPGVFQVMHNDRIGNFRVPAGSYTVTLLSAGRLSCEQATRRFARFLQDYDGRLPGLWLLDWRTGTFIRGTWLVGFRVEPAVTPLPGPTPSSGALRCPATFRVLHDDRIGALRIPRGRYWVTRTAAGRPTCAATTRLLAGFLQRPDGRLPSPWRMRVSTATFVRPSGASFSIKRVR